MKLWHYPTETSLDVPAEPMAVKSCTGNRTQKINLLFTGTGIGMAMENETLLRKWLLPDKSLPCKWTLLPYRFGSTWQKTPTLQNLKNVILKNNYTRLHWEIQKYDLPFWRSYGRKDGGDGAFLEWETTFLGDFKRSEAQLELIKDSCSFENQHPC